jgi:hypothetical protein
MRTASAFCSGVNFRRFLFGMSDILAHLARSGVSGFAREGHVCESIDHYWATLKVAGYAVGDWRSENASKSYSEVVQATKRDLPAVKNELESRFRQVLGS